METETTELKVYEIKEARLNFQCQKCEYQWPPRDPAKESAKCPRCKSYRWRGDVEETEEDATKSYTIYEDVIKYLCQIKTCQHVWEPSTPGREPVKCPRCQSFDWRGEYDLG